MNDKILQNRKSKLEKVLTKRIQELKDKGLIKTPKGFGAKSIATDLMEVIVNASVILVDIKSTK